LTATASGSISVLVSVSAGGLLPGTYAGTVQLTTAGGSISIPVSLKVLAAVAPAVLRVQTSAPLPGTYYGTLAVKWDGGSAMVPITFNATPNPALPPVIATVANAASQLPGALAPGEVISILGMGIGGAPCTLELDASGRVKTELGGTQVLIGGRPAPLIYTSASQVNAIVPYEIAADSTASIQVISNGVQSVAWALSIASSAPGVFTSSASGIGQAAVVNQDNSINGASNPAKRGEVIQIYATGEGQTVPGNATGSIVGSPGNTTLLPVSVSIGGVDSPVLYHGSAPGEIAGVLQVNAVVPSEVAPGLAVPIQIKVGDRQSQEAVTIAVK
jgi:uncharacterized protein (TIGR03437 family)